MEDTARLTKIFISDLTLPCTIGVTQEERAEKQQVCITVTLWAAIHTAFKSDDIKQTVNYKEVYRSILGLVEGNSFNLIERLADEIAGVCLGQSKVRKVEVCVTKPKALKLAACTGVCIVRIKNNEPKKN